MAYAEEGVPLVVLAGKEYGSGSSRDWAAKGTKLLGVRAVIAESFERIHRSNLIGMGVLPLQFPAGESAESLGLTGEETFDVGDLEDGEAKSVTVTRPARAAARRSSSMQPCGSTPRTRSTTSATAASCRPSCATSETDSSEEGLHSGPQVRCRRAAGGRGVRATLTAPARR